MSDDRRALAVIRKCVATDRYALSIHFSRRMAQRGLYWPDIAAVIYRPREVKPQSLDRFGRPKWIITGHDATLGDIEIVCAIEIDESATEFITLYWLD